MLWTYTQHNFAGGRLDKELMGRQDLQQYFKGCAELRNFTITRQGNLSKRRGTDYVCALPSGDTRRFRLIPIVYSKTEGYYLLLTSGLAYLVSKSGVYTTSGTWSATMTNAYSIATGISDDKLDDIDYVQSGDTIFFVHKSFKPFTIVFDRTAMTLTKTIPTFAETSYTAPVIGKAKKTDVDGGTGSKTIRYKVSYVGEDGQESYTSDPISVTYSLPWKSGGTIAISIYDESGQAKAEAYNVYKDDGGGFGYVGKVLKANIADSGRISGETKTHLNLATFTDTYITPDMSVTPPDVNNRRTFSDPDEYPSVVSLYQQRLVFGSSRKDPFTFWMSCTGDIYNFSTHDTLREDDAITATLAATEMPEINHALLAKELMLFTESGEWEIAPVSGNTMSYKTISAKMQSSIGSARHTKPIIIGDEIIFLDASCERLLSTRYNFASDGYESQELTVMSQWLFRNNEVRRIAYRKNPDSHIHCVMADGSIAVMVYMREHEVCAWTRYDLARGGYRAIDVATAKNESNGCTEILYIVRSSSGANEIWRERDIVPYRSTNAITDFICMDRCRVRTEASTSTIAAGHIAVNPTTGAQVTGGNTGAATGSVDGIPFVSKFESVYPDAKGDGETMQMEIQNATETKVRVIDSSSFSVGACSLPTSRDVTVSVSPTFGTGTITLGDVDARVRLVGDNAKQGRIRITHDGAFPLTVLSIATTYQIEPANRNGGSNG